MLSGLTEMQRTRPIDPEHHLLYCSPCALVLAPKCNSPMWNSMVPLARSGCCRSRVCLVQLAIFRVQNPNMKIMKIIKARNPWCARRIVWPYLGRLLIQNPVNTSSRKSEKCQICCSAGASAIMAVMQPVHKPMLNDTEIRLTSTAGTLEATQKFNVKMWSNRTPNRMQ